MEGFGKVKIATTEKQSREHSIFLSAMKKDYGKGNFLHGKSLHLEVCFFLRLGFFALFGFLSVCFFGLFFGFFKEVIVLMAGKSENLPETFCLRLFKRTPLLHSSQPHFSLPGKKIQEKN